MEMAGSGQPIIKVCRVELKLEPDCVKCNVLIPVSTSYPTLEGGGQTWQVFVCEPFNLFLVDNNNLLLLPNPDLTCSADIGSTVLTVQSLFLQSNDIEINIDLGCNIIN